MDLTKILLSKIEIYRLPISIDRLNKPR